MLRKIVYFTFVILLLVSNGYGKERKHHEVKAHKDHRLIGGPIEDLVKNFLGVVQNATTQVLSELQNLNVDAGGVKQTIVKQATVIINNIIDEIHSMVHRLAGLDPTVDSSDCVAVATHNLTDIANQLALDLDACISNKLTAIGVAVNSTIEEINNATTTILNSIPENCTGVNLIACFIPLVVNGPLAILKLVTGIIIQIKNVLDTIKACGDTLFDHTVVQAYDIANKTLICVQELTSG